MCAVCSMQCAVCSVHAVCSVQWPWGCAFLTVAHSGAAPPLAPGSTSQQRPSSTCEPTLFSPQHFLLVWQYFLLLDLSSIKLTQTYFLLFWWDIFPRRSYFSSFHPFSGPVLLGRGLVLTSTRSLSFVFQPLSLIPISPVTLWLEKINLR